MDYGEVEHPGRRGNSDSDVDSGDEDNPPSKSKEDCVQKIVDDLKKQHGEKYTIMQYRIWAETVNGGMHKSMTKLHV